MIQYHNNVLLCLRPHHQRHLQPHNHLLQLLQHFHIPNHQDFRIQCLLHHHPRSRSHHRSADHSALRQLHQYHRHHLALSLYQLNNCRTPNRNLLPQHFFRPWWRRYQDDMQQRLLCACRLACWLPQSQRICDTLYPAHLCGDCRVQIRRGDVYKQRNCHWHFVDYRP